ncbi:MAG: GNAT family N-acetyltransferase [Solirubrobacteraceae bacterium]
MDARRRALRFLHEVDMRAAERVLPSPGGVAVLHSQVPLLWDANHFTVTEPGLAGPRELARAAEGVRRDAGLGHRMVIVLDEAEGRRLARGFGRLGWDLERHLVMALRRPPDRPPPPAVEIRSMPFDQLDGARAEFLGGEPWGRPEVVSQVLRRDRLLAGAVQDCAFAAVVGGRPSAFCRLMSDDVVGQVEDVATLADHRGRGLARAVVGAAVDASREAGHQLTFLTADAADWPQALYRKLGFDDLTLIYRFRIVVGSGMREGT